MLAADSRPDHRTICRFRADHAEALRGLFQVLDMCKRDGLVPAKAVALDGTKVKANASMAKNRTKEQLDKELRDYVEKVFAEAERKDKEEDELYGEENDGFSLPAHLRDRKARREHIREGLRQLKEEADKKKAEEEKKLADRQEKEKEEAAKGKEVRGRKPVQKTSRRPGATLPIRLQDHEDPERLRPGLQRPDRGGLFQPGDRRLRRGAGRQRQAPASPDALPGEGGLGRLPEKLLADAGYFSTKEVDGVEGTELFVATRSRKKAGLDELLPIMELGGRPTTKQAMELLLGTNEGRAAYRLRGQTVEPTFGQLKDRGGMRSSHARNGENQDRSESGQHGK